MTSGMTGSMLNSERRRNFAASNIWDLAIIFFYSDTAATQNCAVGNTTFVLLYGITELASCCWFMDYFKRCF